MLEKLAKSLSFQSNALEMRSKRQSMITSNIANADTPGYKATDVNFSKVLGEVTGKKLPQGTEGSMNSAPKLKLSAPSGRFGGDVALTQAGHMASKRFDRSEFGQSVQFRRGETGALDNNSVNLETERAAFAENTVKYEASLRSINGRIQTLKDAMTGGQR